MGLQVAHGASLLGRGGDLGHSYLHEGFLDEGEDIDVDSFWDGSDSAPEGFLATSCTRQESNPHLDESDVELAGCLAGCRLQRDLAASTQGHLVGRRDDWLGVVLRSHQGVL